jgi:hypothetical protein
MLTLFINVLITSLKSLNIKLVIEQVLGKHNKLAIYTLIQL